ncbi:NAD(P)/FAD-dependent oxidoreductase [Piscinibacter sp.]|uniref:NAD(P)/FAD-dependent oxidoreductase n=1 Tax=Piscinibacter sp. TaxID=1903157 RepID=UPI002BF69722|nr:FAD-binding oxidoreductase [Albitalea sp.]HUG22329.1 FAD-binding oxidoreductase [Albitalea sp.]
MQALGNYYDATVGERTPRPALRHTIDADVCIVGAGFAGLATALGLLERGVKDVVLLEAHQVGFGASGRNGGFVFGGYSLDCADLLAQLGPVQAKTTYAFTRQAVDLIRRRIQHHAIDCDAVEGGALLVNWFRDDALLHRQQRLMAEHFDVDWRFIPKSELAQWVTSDRYSAALLEPDAFHFHPLKYALGAAAAVESLGGRIFERSPAVSIDAGGGGTRVATDAGTVQARHVVIAGGGYLAGLVPQLERAILPIATYVMATEPLGDALHRLLPSRAAIYDTRFAFDYYRKLNDTRLLWGGRISVRDRHPADIAQFLKRDMVKVFPDLRGAQVAHAWGGMMSYARHKMPQIGRLPNGLWYGLGFGGHGVAPTTAAGELLARSIAEGTPLPASFVRYGLPRTFRPFGLAAAQATYAWLQFKDVLRERQAG